MAREVSRLLRQFPRRAGTYLSGAAVLLAMGCTVFRYNAYEGPDLPSERLAMLDWSWTLNCMIDGKVPPFSRGRPYRARLLPGSPQGRL
jgi:hypothetical protein